MAVTVRISEAEYRRIALDAPDRPWELHDGRLREKPGMSVEHGDVMTELGYVLRDQLNRNDFRVRSNHARLRRSSQRYYIPDIAVIPAVLVRALREHPGSLDAYAAPLPLVVEVWSPSTGDYDVDEKLAEYQGRGDLEIWRLHPHERTLIAWRQQPDGSYAEERYRGGIVRPVALPNVEIDLDALFAD